jgi:hypothetical protein
MLLGSKVRPVRRTDKLTATCSRLSRQCVILNISQAYRPPRPDTGIALLLFYFMRAHTHRERERERERGCFKKSVTMIFQILLYGECYENGYT